MDVRLPLADEIKVRDRKLWEHDEIHAHVVCRNLSLGIVVNHTDTTMCVNLNF
jgi:hypothetical protein